MRQYLNRLRPFRTQIILVLCLLAFFAMYMQSYHTTVDRMTRTEINRTLEYMQRGAQEVSTAFYSVFNQVGLWTNNESIKTLARTETELTAQNFADIIKLTRTINETWQPGGLVSFSLLLDNDNGLLISSNDVLHNFRFSFRSGVYCVDNFAYDEFLNTIRSNANLQLTQGRFMPAMTFSRYSYQDLPTTQTTSVSYVYSMPIRRRTHDLYAIISLDVNRLYEEVSGDSAVSEDFFIYSNGTLLYGDESIELDPSRQITRDFDRKVSYISVPVPDTNLHCVMTLEDSVVLSNVQRMTQMNNFIVVALIAACILLVAFFLMSLVRPVYSLARDVGLEDRDLDKDVFAHIRDSIDGIRLDNRRMTSTLSRWEPILHTQIIEHALRGMALSDVEQELLKLVVGESQAWHVALVGRICGSGSIPEEITASIMEQVIICPMDGGRAALMINATDEHSLEEKCEALLEALNLSAASPVFAVGVCPVSVDFYGLRMAFIQASAALDKALWWDNSAVIVYEGAAASTGYSIPYETLNHLYGLVMSGNSEGAESLIRREIRMADPLSSGQSDDLSRRIMYHDLMGVLVRVSEQVNILSVLRSLRSAELQQGFENRLQLLLEGFHYAGEIRASALRDGQQSLSERMKEYILAHYSNPDLSLGMAAEAFNVCDQTFSKLFKDETGVNFSVYLEKVRISASEALLREGRSVSDTAELCGYASSNTFGKAFRRRCGVSPTEWAKAQSGISAAPQKN